MNNAIAIVFGIPALVGVFFAGRDHAIRRATDPRAAVPAGWGERFFWIREEGLQIALAFIAAALPSLFVVLLIAAAVSVIGQWLGA